MTSKEDIKILGMPVSCGRDPASKIARSIAHREVLPGAHLDISIAVSN
jgi:hypothetical protein